MGASKQPADTWAFPVKENEGHKNYVENSPKEHLVDCGICNTGAPVYAFKSDREIFYRGGTQASPIRSAEHFEYIVKFTV